MSPSFWKNPIRHLPLNRAVVLENRTCPYCATDLANSEFSKDHVIARRFIPTGSLNGQWNLIVRACYACNHAKSDLEDDISAITLQPDARGQHPVFDPHRDAEASRKAKGSKSRRKNTSVGQSSEHFNIDLSFGPNAKITFGVTSPPQLDENRVYRLCLMHSRAFFYWLTYDEKVRMGGFWPGCFFPLDYSVRSDWDNPFHKAFMAMVSNWETRLLAQTAGGDFKVAIRKYPSAECWSWAYEWNRNARIIGFFGEEAVARQLVGNLEIPEQKAIHQGEKIIRYREETPLLPEHDKMFSNAERSSPVFRWIKSIVRKFLRLIFR